MRSIKLPVAMIALILLLCNPLLKSQPRVQFVEKNGASQVDVMINGRFVTAYRYGSDLEKPVLYPLATQKGIVLTRGFPLNNRANERTDHPHHVGMWFNYGDVNGLDFWNNSYDIPDSAKYRYGSIRHRKIVAKDADSGRLAVEADWIDPNGKVLLKEATTFVFSSNKNANVIDRVTTLTAAEAKVAMKDNKEGLLGIRVARELEIPSNKPEIFTDASGKPTTVAVLNNEGVTGNYLTGAGKTGDSAWGTRASWCMIYGKKDSDNVAIVIFDHPSNPGYPAYWHARGYGLFAANNLGQEALSGGKEQLNFSIDPGKSASFSYRIMMINGKIPTAAELNTMAEEFGRSRSLAFLRPRR